MKRDFLIKSRTTQPDQILIPIEEVARLLGCSRASMFKAHDAGIIPAPIPLGPRMLRWSRIELEMWAASGGPSRHIWIQIREKWVNTHFLGGAP